MSTSDEASCQIGAYGVPGAASRVHCVPPGIPHHHLFADRVGAARLLTECLVDPARPIVLAVASPVRRKNLSAIIDAFAGRDCLRNTANLVVLAGVQRSDLEGCGIRQELEASVARAGLQGQVALPLRHTTAELKGLYELAAESGGVLVNAALHEPFGLTLLEAARAGLPVVATRYGGAAEIVRRLDNGLLVDPTDPSQISASCWRIVSDTRFAARLRSSGCHRVSAFDWNTYAEKACAIYRAAASRSARNAVQSEVL